MQQPNDTCEAVRPGHSAGFNSCLRGTGHSGVHINALGARWEGQGDRIPLDEPVTGAAARALGNALRAKLSEGCEA